MRASTSAPAARSELQRISDPETLAARLRGLALWILDDPGRGREIRRGELCVVYRGRDPNVARALDIGAWAFCARVGERTRRGSLVVHNLADGAPKTVMADDLVRLRRVDRTELAAVYRPGDRIQVCPGTRSKGAEVVEVAGSLVISRLAGGANFCCPADRIDVARPAQLRAFSEPTRGGLRPLRMVRPKTPAGIAA